ncbi:hypothetical protein B0H17DRAFT_1067735 [Mycena rosella]|uniref:Zn(2)-C6 fungal-type domain-containing protein n=1 Tax=Mycena rosella TaxID=1033263 RepID=A0AAD7DDD6_MYCRO|nr:hypothetical protein B0H17DRAFT_1067735 [Mycena rosella]
MHGTKLKKAPACDACKARRVLCHPQPNGAPCPRCAEKNIRCVTSQALRGRPRKNPMPPSTDSIVLLEGTQNLLPEAAASSSIIPHAPKLYNSMNGCPDLTPDLVAHFFQCFERLPHFLNPIITVTSIRTTIRAISYQLYLLPPESRVLALCIIALSSLVSFHEVVLGDGPRPESFADEAFFSSRPDVLGCGVRRSGVHHALHKEALKAAWEIGVILQVSNENVASCFLLDALEQNSWGMSRPWASAYISHLRALAPMAGPSTVISPNRNIWAGFLMSEALSATGSRKPVLFTRDDQLLLAGSEPPSPEALLASLEMATRKSGTAPFFQSLGPYFFQITCLARQLWETITGDRARLNPISEAAIIQFLASLSLMHGILSRLLDRCDPIIIFTPAPTNHNYFLGEDDGARYRRTAAGLIIGFTGVAFPLHLELKHRERVASATGSDSPDNTPHAQERMRLLRNQAREMAALGARELARGLRYLPSIHYPLITWSALRDYAQFALDQAEAAPIVSHDQIRDLKTFAAELQLCGYSLDLFSAPQNASLVDRMVIYIDNATRVQQLFDPNGVVADIFFHLDDTFTT